MSVNRAAASGASDPAQKNGEQAVSDSKFLLNVKSGANFTLRTYQRVIDWLDAEESREAAE